MPSTFLNVINSRTACTISPEREKFIFSERIEFATFTQISFESEHCCGHRENGTWHFDRVRLLSGARRVTTWLYLWAATNTSWTFSLIKVSREVSPFRLFQMQIHSSSCVVRCLPEQRTNNHFCLKCWRLMPIVVVLNVFTESEFLLRAHPSWFSKYFPRHRERLSNKEDRECLMSLFVFISCGVLRG